MPKKKNKNKSTKAVFEQRVSQLTPLVSFMTRKKILQYVGKQTNWKVSEKQIDNYITRAREYVLEDLKAKRKTAIQDIVNNLSTLYQKALMAEDFKTCITIQDRMTTLLGVDTLLERMAENEEVKEDIVID